MKNLNSDGKLLQKKLPRILNKQQRNSLPYFYKCKSVGWKVIFENEFFIISVTYFHHHYHFRFF